MPPDRHPWAQTIELDHGLKRGNGLDNEPPSDFDHRYGPIDGTDAPPVADRPRIEATPFEWRDPASIERRQWLYGRTLIRKHVSLLIAPGGVGKSTLAITEALALATGRQLLHDRPWTRARVWLWNGEDPADELQRRILGAMIKHEITPADVEGRLFVDSGRQMPLKIATISPAGAVRIDEQVVSDVISTLSDRAIDVWSIDPFVAIYGVSENDNTAMDLVLRAFEKIATEANVAIHVVHHSRKLGGETIDAESARGASAIVAAARKARTLSAMTADDATKAGVEAGDRYAYVKIADAKANLSPRAEEAQWFRLASVDLPNGEGGSPGDSVGVAACWDYPDAFTGVTVQHLRAAQDAVAAGGPWRENHQASGWVGHPIAKALGLDASDPKDRTRVKELVRQWIKSGALTVVMGRDQKREQRPFVEVGNRP